MCSIIRVVERLHKVLGQIDLAHWTQVSDCCPLGYLFSCLFQAKNLKQMPLVLFGILTMIGGILTVALPETHNRPLPDTIEAIEKNNTVKQSSLSNRHCGGISL